MGSTPFPTLIHPVTFTVDSITIFWKEKYWIKQSRIIYFKWTWYRPLFFWFTLFTSNKGKVKIDLRLPGHDILAIVTTASME